MRANPIDGAVPALGSSPLEVEGWWRPHWLGVIVVVLGL